MTIGIIVGTSCDNLLTVIETEIVLVEIGAQCYGPLGVARIFPGKERDCLWRRDMLCIRPALARNSGDAVG